MEKQKIEEDKQKNCNSRWSQDEGGEVWILVIFYQGGMKKKQNYTKG